MNENTNNPWRVTGKTDVYENPWIEVTEYKVVNPSGGNGIYGKVHFKNLAVGIVPLDDKLYTWLVGQYRFVLNQYSWEIPEGGGPLANNPLESAKRELLEETGLVAKEWKILMEMHLSNSVCDERALIYVARNLEQRTPAPEETEQLMVRKMHFDEVYKMVEDGKITDAISVAAILKIKLLLIDGKISS